MQDKQTQETTSEEVVSSPNQRKTASAAISAAYRGQRNILTPYTVDFGMVTPRVAWELSQGEGIERTTLLVGVSVVRKIDGEWTPDYDLSRSFASKSGEAHRYDILQVRAPAVREARAYIASLAAVLA